MWLPNAFKIIFLATGDFLIFVFSLFLAVCLRYNFNFRADIFFSAIGYFLAVFVIWLIAFLIGRLYELFYAANKKEFFERTFKIFIFNIIIAVFYFYLLTPFYRPKAVLILTIVFSFVLFNFWRGLAHSFLNLKRVKTFLIGPSPLFKELKLILDKNPQFGYKIEGIYSLDEFEAEKSILLEEKKDEIIFLISEKKHQTDLQKRLIKNKSELSRVKIIEAIDFFESVAGRTPLAFLTEEWFLENYLNKRREIYEFIKRCLDLTGGIVLFFISLPLWPLIAGLIKLDSQGSVVYQSVRLGKNKKRFKIYKFRTMAKNADKIGPSWTVKNDARITRIGKLLRLTHLDEVPQVLNIIKGDISFVGPRPEEEKLAGLFEKEIPFYHYRFLIKPGVIGWAQINYPHGASIDDARYKLEYDFYYLKNRSILFDLIVSLKAWRIPFEIPTH